jgi:hypothetical protein
LARAQKLNREDKIQAQQGKKCIHEMSEPIPTLDTLRGLYAAARNDDVRNYVGHLATKYGWSEADLRDPDPLDLEATAADLIGDAEAIEELAEDVRRQARALQAMARGA